MEKLQALLDATPRLKYLGRAKLKEELKGQGISHKVIDEYFKQSDIKQVFSAVNKKPQELQYKITAMPKSFQIDIVYFGYSKKKTNKGHGHALLLVDILSRKCWLYPMKTRDADAIIDAYGKFLKQVGLNDVKSVQLRATMVMGDDEFAAKAFQTYNNELGIRLFTDIAKDDHITGDGDRLGILDRLVGTLKRQLQMRYVEAGVEGDWMKYIQDIVSDYNDTKHGTLHMTPNQAWALPIEDQIQRYTIESKINRLVDDSIEHYQPGQRVRILENLDTFTKGTKPKWSTKVYTVQERSGYKYTVEGLSRRFKANELMLVGDKARDLIVDKTATQQDKARRKIQSKKEGISVDEYALAGVDKKRAKRDKKESRTLRELNIKQGEFIVLDADGAPDEPARLRVDHPRKRRVYGYVFAGWVTRKTKGKLHVLFLESADENKRSLKDRLKVLEESEPIDDKGHADSLLYRSSEIQRASPIVLPQTIVESVQREFVFE